LVTRHPIESLCARAGVLRVTCHQVSPGVTAGRLCNHCGPWNWPPEHPTRTIYLHERCEAPWYDQERPNVPEGIDG
jgi:hypothetical protein